MQEIVGEAYITNVAVSEKIPPPRDSGKAARRGGARRNKTRLHADNARSQGLQMTRRRRSIKNAASKKSEQENFYSDPREDAEIMTKFFDR